MNYDLFVGIDWSGAKGHRHRGISVFVCEKGDATPHKISPPDGKSAFSRADVVRYLEDLSNAAKVLAGIDFAFAYPVDKESNYFPDLPSSQPKTAQELWYLIEHLNSEAEDFYGGVIWDHPLYGPYYNAPSGRRGLKFQSRRRETEKAASAVKSPSPTFNCVGPAGVGTGSLAGMRLCHYFAKSATIWPFHTKQGSNLTLVEIFPSYYFKMAGITPVNGQQAQIDTLNMALRYFHSRPVSKEFVVAGPDADDADALISAAALRSMSCDPASWLVPDIAQREGWIFGVKSDTNQTC
ncbi:MAG: hypothetical protein ACON49_00730 [Candidatus Puniceispirillaceae bacterium]